MGHIRPRHRRLRTAAVGSLTAALTVLSTGGRGLRRPVQPLPARRLRVRPDQRRRGLPPGYSAEPAFDPATGTGAFGDNGCTLDYLEPFAEKSAANGQAQTRTSAPFAATPEGAYASALNQREQLLAAGAVTPGGWKLMGNGPARSDVAAYPRVSGLGLNDIAGRMEDLTVDPANPQHIIGAAAGGGVWESLDGATTWQSVGDRLPTQVARRGRLRALRPAPTSPAPATRPTAAPPTRAWASSTPPTAAPPGPTRRARPPRA